jgi:O-antigen/teichoic acid export membrane protein
MFRRAMREALAPALVVGGRMIQHALVLVAFILIARALGRDGLGAFFAAQGIANILSPFVEVGGVSLVTRALAAGDPAKPSFDRAMTMLLVRAPIFIVVNAVFGWIVFSPAMIAPFALISIAEIVLARTIEIVYAINFSAGRPRLNAGFDVLVGVARVLSAGLLFVIGGNLLDWCLIYAIQLAFVAVVILVASLGMDAGPAFRRAPSEWRANGLSFALSVAARSALPELDRVFLARLSGLNAAGLYGAGSRLVYIATMPFFMLQMMKYPEFFRAGKHGYAGARAVARAQVLRLAPLGLAATAAIWLAAPYTDLVLGPSYSDTGGIVRSLCVIVALYSIYEPFGNALNGSGQERLRRTFQIAAVVFNILLNLAFDPFFGEAGAAVAAVAAHLLLFGLFVLAAPRLIRERHHGQIHLSST